MKNEKMKPIFIGVVIVLLVVLGIVVGIIITKNGEKEPTGQDVTESVENSQMMEGEVSASEGTETIGRDENVEATEQSESIESTEQTESAEVAEGTETQESTEDADEQGDGPYVPPVAANAELFVILGIDSRTSQLGAGSYSDSIMIVYVNHDTKIIKVASVLRDCMVNIKGHGFEKITHANYYGGPALALNTINSNFDFDINEYVQVNFNSLVDVVDLIGGVEMELTDAECHRMQDSRFEKAGTYLLNGQDALKYSRMRNTAGGDYKRSERQRDILFAIFEKSKTLPVDERIELVDEMIDQIDTSYRQDEIVDILYYVSTYEIASMSVFPQVFYGGNVDGAWVEVPVTLIDMNAGLHRFLFGATDYKPSETVKENSAILEDKAPEANNNDGS